MGGYQQHDLDLIAGVVFIVGVTGAILFGRLAKQAWKAVS
jgi:hypothetical protein